MNLLSKLTLLGALSAVSAPTLALTIDFGSSGSPAVCAASADGLGALMSCGNSSFINQSYGDVSDLVEVTYGAPLLGQSLQWWSTRYNNLYGVSFAGGSDASSTARIELMSQDPLAGIELVGFDLGAYADAARGTNVTIYDLADGSVLYSALGITVGTAGGANLPTSFALGVSSSKGIAIEWFNSAYNVGIDNIEYNVTAVPEPESYAMLLAGLGVIGAMVKRRRG